MSTNDRNGEKRIDSSERDPRRVVINDLRRIRQLAKGTPNEPEILSRVDKLADELGLPTGPGTETRTEAER